MVLLSANKLLVDSFVKKMSQIRQNNQCVIVIAQISKMLPNSIKDLAESCFFFENNNVKGLSKSSKVKHYRTGYDYTTFNRNFHFLTFTGFMNPRTHRQPKSRKICINEHILKMALIFGSALLLFVFVFTSSILLFRIKQNLLRLFLILPFHRLLNLVRLWVLDSFCVRSWHYMGNSVVHYIDDSGIMGYIPLSDFSQLKKCSLYPKDSDKIKK